ncbi:MAG TPA: EAL domain-containing protein [Nitrospirae bacterium]|nr:EAL domain-containing protein [Nitrospirota bacterium]
MNLPITPEDAILIDRDGNIITISDSLDHFLKELCQEKPKEITNYIHFWEGILKNSKDKKKYIKDIEALLRGDRKYVLIEFVDCQKEQHKYTFLNLIRLAHDMPLVAIQHIDVTELLIKEHNIKKNLKKLQIIINNQSEFICLLHADTIVSFANDALCQHLSLSYEDIIGQPFLQLLPYKEIKEQIQKGLSSLSKEQQIFAIEHLLKDSSSENDIKWIQWHVKALFDNDGTLTGYHFTGREVSDLQRQKAIKQKEQALINMAYNDPVTGLPKRALFMDRLIQLILKAKRYNKKIALLFIDLDNFKKINESLGYDIGDILLKEASERIKYCLRNSDVISRISADDYGIILSEIDKPENTQIVAERIIKAISSPFELKGNSAYITASIGISIFPEDGEDAEILFKNAEIAMNYAKSQDKNNYKFFNNAMNQHALERLKIENDLRMAIEQKQFILHFQPQISMKNGNIVGVEALVRWLHPEKGMIPPMKFIPIAEETGLIIPISELILFNAIKEIQGLQTIGLPQVSLAVNISLKHFKQPNFSDFIFTVLRETKIPPHMLELELTESIFMHDVNNVVKILRTFKDEGITISIDDFGTGYSSLNYLKNLPISKLKIDKAFVNNITTDNKDAMIVKTIIDIAHNLNLKVIAEGVEHLEQMEFLRNLNCDELQGYLFSKPLPSGEFAKLYAAMAIL